MANRSENHSGGIELLGSVSNDGRGSIETALPYRVNVRIQGSADILFHRWSDDGVAAKAAAAKGSKAKKTDDVESYVYRHPESGNIAIPGEYLRASIVQAARFEQDPRSPRKSAMELFKAGVMSLTNLSDTGCKEWDYLDRRRVVIQRNALTRVRPALKSGWSVEYDLMVILPEYVEVDLLRKAIDLAGRVVGVGDFRPTFGRFHVSSWKLLGDV
jgi:hypothetical protein